MTPEQVRHHYRNDVLPASFSAQGPGHGADRPRVLVYAFRTGRIGGPYLWAFMEGEISEEGETVIKDGGKCETYREACELALDRLMERVDK